MSTPYYMGQMPQGSAPSDPNAERAMAYRLLQPYARLNFVKRILRPQGAPKLQIDESTEATHMMGWTTLPDGRAIMYPSVVQQGDHLVRLGQREAVQHALSTGEYVPLPNGRVADWLSRRYKTLWGER